MLMLIVSTLLRLGALSIADGLRGLPILRPPLPDPPPRSGRGSSTLSATQVRNEPIAPRIETVAAHDLQHRGLALAPLVAMHRQPAIQCGSNPRDVVRVDDQRCIQFA